MKSEIAEIAVAKSSDEIKAMSLVDQAKSFIIVTNEDRERAEQLTQDMSAMEKVIFAYLDPPRAKAYEDYQYHKKRLDDAYDPIIEERKAFKQRIIAWDDEQERIRQDDQRKAEQAARKRAEDEALALAAQAEAEGDHETAEAIIAEPVQVAPVFVPKSAPAASRLSSGREVWSGQCVNLMALVKAVAEGRQPLSYLEASKTALQVAAKMKAACNIQGLRAVSRRV